MAAGDFDPLELLTLDEVSALLRRSRRSLYEDIDAGRLRVVKLGRSTRVPRVELERYIEAAAEDGATLATVHKLDKRGAS